MLFFLLAALQAAAPPGTLADLDGNYCLETGYCRAPDDGYRKPPSGLLFLAIGLAGLGAAGARRRWPG